MKRLFYLLLLAGLLNACSSRDTVITSSPITGTVITTNSPSITFTPTHTSTPTATYTWTPRPSFTPTPTVEKEAPLEGILLKEIAPAISRYKAVIRLDYMIPGLIKIFLATQSNELIIAGDYGATWISLDTDRYKTKRIPGKPLGLDYQEHLWFESSELPEIYKWDGRNLVSYDESDGWASNLVFDQVGAIVNNFIPISGNSIWIASSRDIRFFDGSSWRIFTPSEVNFSITNDSTNSISITYDQINGSLWAGSCRWKEDMPVSGSGPVIYDGKFWKISDFPLSDECIMHMALAMDGSLWLTTSDELWRRDSLLKIWENYPLPISNDSSQMSIIEYINPAPDDSLWLLVSTQQLGKPYRKILYQVVNGKVTQKRQYPSLISQSMVYVGDQIFSFEEGKLFQFSADHWNLVLSDTLDKIAADDSGILWAITGAKTSPIIWRIPIEPGNN